MELAKKSWVLEQVSAAFASATVVIGNALKTGYNKITGYTKIDYRPTGGGTNSYALQVRHEAGNTSGSVISLDHEAHVKATGTASLRGVQGVAVLDTTFTATGATYTGLYGQFRSDGTFAGSGFGSAIYALVEASAAMTASHICSAWLDSHQNNAVTGNHELLYMSNNGTASLDQVMYASGQAEALLHVNTAGGAALNYLSDGDAGKKKIKILIEGVAYTLEATPV